MQKNVSCHTQPLLNLKITKIMIFFLILSAVNASVSCHTQAFSNLEIIKIVDFFEYCQLSHTAIRILTNHKKMTIQKCQLSHTPLEFKGV